MADVVFIYALVDPRQIDVRCVGQSKNPEQRYGVHRDKQSRSHSKALQTWRDELAAEGVDALLESTPKIDPIRSQ